MTQPQPEQIQTPLEQSPFAPPVTLNPPKPTPTPSPTPEKW